jgi:hypothetical protein
MKPIQSQFTISITEQTRNQVSHRKSEKILGVDLDSSFGTLSAANLLNS